MRFLIGFIVCILVYPYLPHDLRENSLLYIANALQYMVNLIKSFV